MLIKTNPLEVLFAPDEAAFLDFLLDLLDEGEEIIPGAITPSKLRLLEDLEAIKYI